MCNFAYAYIILESSWISINMGRGSEAVAARFARSLSIAWQRLVRNGKANYEHVVRLAYAVDWWFKLKLQLHRSEFPTRTNLSRIIALHADYLYI